MNELHPDYLRTPQNLCDPDPRNRQSATSDGQNSHTITINDHYESVKKLTLNSQVPERINIQFETSKNLLLYAWFVYRFYPIARFHALTVLEMALKERFEDEIPADDTKYRNKNDKRLMLRSLLRYCKDNNILRNEKFEAARYQAETNANNRHRFENIRLMDELGLSELEIDDSDIEIKEKDWNFDHVEVLRKTLPEIRNFHAHGSSMLDKNSLDFLLTVSEIINQLWPE